MAGRKAGSPSRSEFIRKQLTAKPETKLAEINEAWKKAGHSGEITATLFYQVKSKSGGAKTGRRGRPRKDSTAAPSSASSSGSPVKLLQAASAFISEAGSVDNAIATLQALKSFNR